MIELRVGSRLWLDGDTWTLTELGSSSCTISDGTRARTVATNELAGRARMMLDGPQVSDSDDRELVAVLLGSLTADQLRQLEARAAVVGELLGPDLSRVPTAEQVSRAAAGAEVSTRTMHRWIAGYRDAGMAGLADSRLLGRKPASVDPRWDATAGEVLREFTSTSTPTMNVVIDRIRSRVEQTHGPGVVVAPSRATAYRRVKLLAKGRHTFGSAKARRSVANRPPGPYGRLRATRPGEYVVLDTTPLDVFAMEPLTLRWVPAEITVAQDLYTRCVLGLRVTAVSTRSADVANVLYQCVTAQQAGPAEGTWPFHGVPRHVLVGTEELDGGERAERLPGCLPEAIVVDHGKAYLSAHVISACARIGITIQPAIPNKPTDKPTVERFFRTLREGLLQHLPAYKGPDVYNRGKDVEGQAFLYVAELEQIIREWVGRVYHHTKHDGLCLPEIPGAPFSPAEMFELGLAKAGGLMLPAKPDLSFEFLEVVWRTIQHYGVEVNGLRYDGPALNLHRNTRSTYGGMHAGKWPIFIDSHDVRRVWFHDPDSKTWQPLICEHAPALDAPFSRDAVEYAKRIALRDNRHLDPHRAVTDLLTAWSRDEVTSRRDRGLALRLSAQRAQASDQDDPSATPSTARDVASLPGVIDLLAARESRIKPLEVVDDLFEQYYAEHPDEKGLAVFDD